MRAIFALQRFTILDILLAPHWPPPKEHRLRPGTRPSGRLPLLSIRTSRCSSESSTSRRIIASVSRLYKPRYRPAIAHVPGATTIRSRRRRYLGWLYKYVRMAYKEQLNGRALMSTRQIFARAAPLTMGCLLPALVAAQWIDYPTPGIPRLSDGKPNLAAPAPRTADGKPDLSGVWGAGGPSYRFNIAQDLKPGDVQPWAEKLFLERVRDSRKESPLARCLPVSIPFHNAFNLMRIVQTPGLIVILYESPNSPHRTVFTDGRPLPKDPNPTWLGYSVGRWEGDTLVIDSAGFNDLAWLDSAGHPQTESLRITERLRRRDFGHLEFQMTIDDPKVFTKPFTIKMDRLLAPDTELLEDVCENERDQSHLTGGSRIRLTPETLSKYVGTYELAPGREIIVTLDGDLLFVQGFNQPKLPLMPTSETNFMSTATPDGFQFVMDAQGAVTQLIRQDGASQQRAIRKGNSAQR